MRPRCPPRVVLATKAEARWLQADMGRYKKKGKKKASVSIIVSVVILAAIGVGCICI